jgi:hypothetical protein
MVHPVGEDFGVVEPTVEQFLTSKVRGPPSQPWMAQIPLPILWYEAGGDPMFTDLQNGSQDFALEITLDPND